MADETVLVRGKFFLHRDYLTAVNESFLKMVSDVVPQGSSPRRVARVLTNLKTPAGHARILEAAIQRMLTTLSPIPALEAHEQYGTPIAEFP